MRSTILALLVISVAPASAHACRASTSGAFSYQARLSPRAGRACLHIVEVYEGPRCEADRRAFSVELGCSETQRMTLSDRGRLVSVLAPRASQPDWDIVRVTWLAGERVVSGSVPLRELAPHRSARVELDGDAVRVLGPGDPIRVELEAIERAAAASPRVRPRLGRPAGHAEASRRRDTRLVEGELRRARRERSGNTPRRKSAPVATLLSCVPAP